MRDFLIGRLANRRLTGNAAAVRRKCLVLALLYGFLAACAGSAAARAPATTSLSVYPGTPLYRLEAQGRDSLPLLVRASGGLMGASENWQTAGVELLYAPYRFDPDRAAGAFRVGATEPYQLTARSLGPAGIEAQLLPSYRVIWLAGVGLAVLLGGMFLCWLTRYPRWFLGLVTGNLSADSPPTNVPPEMADPRPADEARITANPGGPRPFYGGSGIVASKIADGPSALISVTEQDEPVASFDPGVDEAPLYPVYDQCQNTHIFEEDDWNYPVDELGNAIEQANLFCEFKQFKSAREVLEPLAGIDDVRLYGAIAKIEIQEIESKKLKS